MSNSIFPSGNGNQICDAELANTGCSGGVTVRTATLDEQLSTGSCLSHDIQNYPSQKTEQFCEGKDRAQNISNLKHTCGRCGKKLKKKPRLQCGVCWREYKSFP